MKELLVKLLLAAALFYVLTPGVLVTLHAPLLSVPATHAVLFALASVFVMKHVRKALGA